MTSRSVILACETQAREFVATLLLACVAGERGLSVVVGAKKEINRRIGSLPRSIFLSKSLTRRNLLMYDLLGRLGHTIVCGDEEALVYASPASYLHHKVSASTLHKAEVLLAWGSENARIWAEYPEFHGAPIHVTGNSRVDLLRAPVRPFFDPVVEGIRDRFAPFVLLNTNFSRLNHYFPGQSRQRRALDAAPAVLEDDLELGLAAHKARLFEHFRELVPALARACPEQTLVIRPHPSEKHEVWREVARGCPNVAVVYEGSVVPWLLAAEMLVHNGCTTAIEAYLSDVPAVAYQPVTSERFDLQLPNLLSHRAFELESLLEAVTAQLKGGIPRDPSAEAKKEELIDQYVAARRGPYASERIAEILEELAGSQGASRRPPSASYLLGRVTAATRGLMQRVEAHIPGHHNNLKYLRHMFPGASLREVESSIATFGRLLDRFSRVRARKLFENVFEITSG